MIEEKIIANYWRNKVLGKDLVSWDASSTDWTESVSMKIEDLAYFNRLTASSVLAEYTIFLGILSAISQRYFETNHLIYSEGFGQGKRTPLLYEFDSIKGQSIQKYLQKVKEEIQEVYKYSDYDSKLIGEYSLDKYAEIGFFYNGETKRRKDWPLQININKSDKELRLSIYVSEEKIEKKIASHLLFSLRNWLLRLEQNKGLLVEEISLLQSYDKSFLKQFNGSLIDNPTNKSVIALFEEQVERTPESIAIKSKDQELTYRELDERSNQLADYLIENYSIRANDLIGLKLDRNEWMIISILGILKAGGAYVPVDPSYPEERIKYLISNSASKLCIDEEELLHFRKKQQNYSKSRHSLSYHASNLLYVIYTSGTTGLPKGVKVRNDSFVNLLAWYEEILNIRQEDVFLLIAPISFDLAQKNLFAPLVCGASLYLSEEYHADYHSMLSIIEKQNVSIINCSPSAFYPLLDVDFGSNFRELASMKKVVLGGEPIKLSLFKNWMLSENFQAEIINSYGPTECTDTVSSYILPAEHTVEDFSLPIGKPLNNVQIHIMDANHQTLPIGLIGEILIGGICVSDGYLNSDELTAEKFIPDPFNKGQRMYKTGDIGRWLPDGNVEFLGRIDDQVKIRGHRIEPGEIERCLENHNMVRETAVLAKTNSVLKTDELVCYVVLNKQSELSFLKPYLEQHLPSFMIPGRFVQMSSLPLTPNGKIDRKKLRTQVDSDILKKDFEAPSNNLERKVIIIWQDILETKNFGVTDDFFALGGHSLAAGLVINNIYKELNKTISYKEFLECATVRQICEKLTAKDYHPIPKAESLNSYPLTDAQQSIWLLSQLEGGNLAYNIATTIRLKGTLDITRLEVAFKEIINRHEILRTYFKIEKTGEIRQYVLPENSIEFCIELRDLSGKSKESIDDHLKEYNNIPFDLMKSPLLRVLLIKSGEKSHLLCLNLHHIIGDGWSLELMVSELIHHYNTTDLGDKNLARTSEFQYKDYAIWLDEQMSLNKYEKSKKYWLEKLSGELPILELPAYKKRPNIQTYNGATKNRTFSADFLLKVNEFSRSNQVTLFVTLMAGIKVLMHRYTGQNDIICGTPIAGRTHPDIENQLGLYLNTLAIRTKITEEQSFLNILSQEKENLFSAYEHQEFPFDAIVRELKLKRDRSRSALFDVMVVLQNQSQLASIKTNEKLAGLTIEDYDFDRGTSHFDMSFIFTQDNGLNLAIEYNSDIYDEQLIDNIFGHFENLLTGCVDKPNECIDSIEYLNTSEIRLLNEFNETRLEYPNEKLIIDLIEEQANKTPNHVAIVFEDRELTYKELNEVSNQLAAYLQTRYAIQPDDLIGILLERSEWMIISMLGVLKSGAAYVPVDPVYPQERIDYILTNSACKVCVDENELSFFRDNQNSYPKSQITSKLEPSNLAYIIYTSGSTGQPKGVMVEHQNAMALIAWAQSEFDSSKINVVYATTSFCFDLSVYEVFYTLSIGKKIKVLNSALSIEKHLEHDTKVLINTVPSSIRNLIEEGVELSNVSIINVAGEPFPVEICDKLLSYDIEVRNLYGPTEDTTYSTCYRLAREKSHYSVPIGRPIANTQVHILDSALQRVPVGIIGKLYTSGNGVSRGYFRSPNLTAEKFIPSPFHESEMLYETGDLGRWLPDGNIEFLGRTDDQVKIRGFRIEPSEIEHMLLENDKVEKAVVLARKLSESNDRELEAYVVLHSDLDLKLIKDHLEANLPSYMVPKYVVALNSLPLLPNGKVDKNALPLQVGSRLTDEIEYIPPNTEIEHELATIWSEILEVEKIGVNDDFFMLGGHSLKAVKILNSVQLKFDIRLDVVHLFRKPTIYNISKEIEKILWLSNTSKGLDKNTQIVEI